METLVFGSLGDVVVKSIFEAIIFLLLFVLMLILWTLFLAPYAIELSLCHDNETENGECKEVKRYGFGYLNFKRELCEIRELVENSQDIYCFELKALFTSNKTIGEFVRKLSFSNIESKTGGK